MSRVPGGYLTESSPTIRFIVRQAMATRRDQRAVCFASRAVGRPCSPFDDARSLRKLARSSRAALAMAAGAAGFRLRLGGGCCAPAAIR